MTIVLSRPSIGELLERRQVSEPGVGDAWSPQHEPFEARCGGQQPQVVVGGRPIRQVDGDDLPVVRSLDPAGKLLDSRRQLP